MTTEATTRTRDQVEQELERTRSARNAAAKELREVRGKLEVATGDEAAGVEEAARAGKAPKATGNTVSKLEDQERQLQRRLEALDAVLPKLQQEIAEYELAELEEEQRQHGQYARELLEKKKEVTDEYARACADGDDLRRQIYDKKRQVRTGDKPRI